MMLFNNLLIFIIIVGLFYSFTTPKVFNKLQNAVPARLSAQQSRMIVAIFFGVLIFAAISILGLKEGFSVSYATSGNAKQSIDNVFLPGNDSSVALDGAQETGPSSTTLASVLANGSAPSNQAVIGFLSSQGPPQVAQLRSLENNPFDCPSTDITCKSISGVTIPDAQVFNGKC